LHHLPKYYLYLLALLVLRFPRVVYLLGAARHDVPAIPREDLYKFVDMVDDAPRHPGCPISRELDYGITDEWEGLDARDDRSELRGRVNLLYRDRPIHHHLAVAKGATDTDG
ncbi:hypothetical protein Tco_0415948, partial [Tanacetum coccineum]